MIPYLSFTTINTGLSSEFNFSAMDFNSAEGFDSCPYMSKNSSAVHQVTISSSADIYFGQKQGPSSKSFRKPKYLCLTGWFNNISLPFRAGNNSNRFELFLIPFPLFHIKTPYIREFPEMR